MIFWLQHCDSTHPALLFSMSLHPEGTLSRMVGMVSFDEERLHQHGASIDHIRTLQQQSPKGPMKVEPQAIQDLSNMVDQIFQQLWRLRGKAEIENLNVHEYATRVLFQCLAILQKVSDFDDLFESQQRQSTYVSIISLSTKLLSQVLWHQMSPLLKANGQQETRILRLMGFEWPVSALQWLDIFKARLSEFSRNPRVALEIYQPSRQSMCQAVASGRQVTLAPRDLAMTHFVHQIIRRAPHLPPADARRIVGLELEPEAA